jgi:hypothetical protein
MPRLRPAERDANGVTSLDLLYRLGADETA